MSKIEQLYSQRKWKKLQKAMSSFRTCAVGEKLNLQTDPRTDMEIETWLINTQHKLFTLGNIAWLYADNIRRNKYKHDNMQKLRKILDKIKEHKL